jgi:pSer/pThr/pTyr-binding forkhead associated (FHA) protein
MGSEPMNPGGQLDAVPAESQASAQGICATCGRPLPEPDLEGVAADVDHRLSLEFGQLVARSAWAGRAPDGLLDGLLSFMPGVKAKKTIWQRGQTLWTELMTAALTGPCAQCQAAGVESTGPAPTMIQSAMPIAESQRTMMLPPDEAVPAAPSSLPGANRPDPGPASGGFDLPTRAIPMSEPLEPPPPPPPSTYNPASSLPLESPTMAFTEPAPARPSEPAPRPSAAVPSDDEEYESHTVMIPAVPSISAGPVLVVLDGPVHGRQFSVDRTTTTIGRSIGCHVTITDDKVGYEHARLIRDDGRYRLEVTAGAGGTFVNDERVTGPRSLKSGDIVKIGPARFRFEAAS